MAAESQRKQPKQHRGRSEEFQRFEDLARKLTKVPKAEVDAKRNGSKRPARSAPRK